MAHISELLGAFLYLFLSTSAVGAFDRPGEGSARPRIVRGFRPESISDDELDQDKRLRSVSFEDQ